MMFRLERCDEAFATNAPRRFVNRVSTSLHPDLVFDVVSNILELEQEWFPDFVSSTWKTPPPHGVGSGRVNRFTYMTVEEDFLVWERGRRLVLRLTECSLPMLSAYVEDYQLERRDDGGTELTWVICYRPLPLIALLHPIVWPFFERDFKRAAERLDRLFTRLAAEPTSLESATPTTRWEDTPSHAGR
jgi:hypothetical protein